MFFQNKKLFSNDKTGVLFVCMGNICRSPAGEGVFKQYIEEQGKSHKFFIDSAGTIGSHAGQPADPRMVKAAECRGYQLDSLARKVNRKDLNDFDLVLAMDFDNLMYLYTVAKSEPDHIRLFGSFLDGAQGNARARSVPDPYSGGAAGFETVLDMIEAATPKIYQYCSESIKK